MSLKQLGDTLKAKRIGQDLTLSDIARRTRIPMRHLQALESGDISLLPGLAYAKAFMKHYARVVEIPMEDVEATLYPVLEAEYQQQNRKRVRTKKRWELRERRVALQGNWQWVGVVIFLAVFWILTSVILNAIT